MIYWSFHFVRVCVCCVCPVIYDLSMKWKCKCFIVVGGFCTSFLSLLLLLLLLFAAFFDSHSFNALAPVFYLWLVQSAALCSSFDFPIFLVTVFVLRTWYQRCVLSCTYICNFYFRIESEFFSAVFLCIHIRRFWVYSMRFADSFFCECVCVCVCFLPFCRF